MQSSNSIFFNSVNYSLLDFANKIGKNVGVFAKNFLKLFFILFQNCFKFLNKLQFFLLNFK